MSEFTDLKEEISMWSADDIVDAVEAVKKARSKDAVTNALSELQAKLEEQRDAIEEELNNERERVEALETAQQSIEDCSNCTHIPACQFEPEWDPADVVIKERA